MQVVSQWALQKLGKEPLPNQNTATRLAGIVGIATVDYLRVSLDHVGKLTIYQIDTTYTYEVQLAINQMIVLTNEAAILQFQGTPMTADQLATILPTIQIAGLVWTRIV